MTDTLRDRIAAVLREHVEDQLTTTERRSHDCDQLRRCSR